eukprot:TRINITY_DN3481_c0_g1_i1.p1 TRINITY_DN3481_c0_g1~~TRINITY_DN3481_c0_g1_i1.p1  ORF type:complete len:1080 (+),score=284.58 TRINITY_DN3481_c0_g1_i1:26-3265(+)
MSLHIQDEIVYSERDGGSGDEQAEQGEANGNGGRCYTNPDNEEQEPGSGKTGQQQEDPGTNPASPLEWHTGTGRGEDSWLGDEDEDDDIDEQSMASAYPSVGSPPSGLRPRYARSAISQSEAADLPNFEYKKTVREQIHELLEWRPVAMFFMVLIILSTLAFLLETVPQLSSDPDYGNPATECPWFVLETVFITFFTLEYVVRWATDNYPLSFPFELFNIVDLISILPYYLEILISRDINPCISKTHDSVVDLRFIRVIRLARVFRVLKLSRQMSATTVLIHTFANSKDALMVPFFFLLLGMVVFASLMYLVEQGTYNPEDQLYYITDSEGHRVVTFFVSIPDALWWAIVTMTTVGYGDMYPRTAAGKALNSIAMMFGVLFFAMPIAIVGSEFTKAWEAKKRRDEEELTRQAAINADAEKSKLEPSTKNWGERELKHFRIYFDESNCTLEEFMGLRRDEKAEGNAKIRPSKEIVPEHFNWGFFGKNPKPKKIATQLGTSDFYLNAPDIDEFSGEYRRKSKTHAVWEKSDGYARLESIDGHWTVKKVCSEGAYLRSEKRHGGSLPSLKTQWVIVDPEGTVRETNAKLAGERRDLVIRKAKHSHLEKITFTDTETGVVLTAAEDELSKAFVGRKLLNYDTVDDLYRRTYEMTTVVLLFAPRFVADPSLLDLANKIYHIFRTQRYETGLTEKNTQMYTKDFVVQLYHHLGFARLPTGFRSRAGLKITCGTECGAPNTEFIFHSDSDLGVFGLGPGTVVPVYCMANEAKTMHEQERKGSIGGELLALAQNFYLNAGRKRSQRVFLVTYRGTDVRFYSALFPAAYLEAVTTGHHKDELDAISVSTFPNRPDGRGVPGYPDTVRVRDVANERKLVIPWAGVAGELDVMDDPLRVLSVDAITQSGTGLRPGMRIHEVNGVPVGSVLELGNELAKLAADSKGKPDTVLTVSVEHDALDFLNPSERAAITDLLQRIRFRIVKYLREYLADNVAYAPMFNPTIRDTASNASSRQVSMLYPDAFGETPPQIDSDATDSERDSESVHLTDRTYRTRKKVAGVSLSGLGKGLKRECGPSPTEMVWTGGWTKL